MTSRRVLHRLALLLAVALVCAPIAACGGGGGSGNDVCPGHLRNATPAPVPEASREKLDAAVARAFSIASYYYIGQFNAERALRESWLSAEGAASKAGVRLPSDFLSGISQTDRVAFYRESFRRLAAQISGLQDEQHIIDAALDGFAKSFADDHTYYFSKRIWEANENGRIYSVGILAEMALGSHLITEVFPDSPASRAGLSQGDSILEARMVEGGENGGFRFRIHRRSAGTTEEITLQPEPLSWVRSSLIDEVGYIRLYRFPSFTTCEALLKIHGALDDALRDLKSRGAKAWILDLRDNGGGYTETAGIVATRYGFDGLLFTGRDNQGRRHSLDIVADNAIGNAPLVILTDSGSASASEVVAYTLQESRRAHVVGEQSAGSVVGARPFPVANGRFFITATFIDVGPGNKVLDKIGVTPDRKVALDLELLRREGRDSQLEAATSYLKQRLGR